MDLLRGCTIHLSLDKTPFDQLEIVPSPESRMDLMNTFLQHGRQYLSIWERELPVSFQF
jgi:hypothetical protein